jgi:hypothetical protein
MARVALPKGIIAFFFLMIFCLSGPGIARTWNVPGDAPTIQAGIDSASGGDTVLVASGVYNEYEIVIDGKSGLLLTSETGEADCVTIDATNAVNGGVMQCLNLDFSTRVKGFTMINGTRLYDGGGIYCNNADLTFENCVIAGNSAGGTGGGVQCSYSSPTFSRCTIAGNVTGQSGSGLHIRYGSATLTSTIIAFNAPSSAVVCSWGASASLACCDVYGNDGGDWANCIAGMADIDGNFSADPLFCAPDSNDFRLRYGSPCMDDLFCGVVGALGAGGCFGGWRVPQDAPTIQAGIDSASAGDTVIVECGTYYEQEIVISNKPGLVLMSETGEARCVTIDATNTESAGVMQCINLDSTAMVKGITMLNGTRTYDAGGVYCNNADLTFENCIIADNSCGQRGGGVMCTNCSPTFLRCTISDNLAGWGMGGGVYCLDGSPTLTNTIISFSAGGEAIGCSGISAPILTCCDVYGNAGGDWVGCIAGQAGMDGNLSEDPVYCDAVEDRYRIEPGSPCDPINQPACGLIGAGPPGCYAGIPSRGDPSAGTQIAVSAGPNPSRSGHRITYRLPDDGGVEADISLRLYDAAGRRIRTLIQRTQPAGSYVADWDGTDDRNRPLPPGVYFLRLEAGRHQATFKVVLLE